MPYIERIEIPKSFHTCFRILPNNNKEAIEFLVPKWDADAIQTKIENATMVQMKAMFQSNSTSVIKGTKPS